MEGIENDHMAKSFIPGKSYMKFSFVLPLAFAFIFAFASASRPREIENYVRAVETNNVRNARRALGKGVSVDDPIDETGFTALMLAAEIGHVKMIKFLTDNGASMVKVDRYGYNPLHFAAGPKGASEGLIACLEISKEGMNAIENEQGNTPLHFAAANGFVDKVTILVEAGADLTIRNTIGNTPIIAACYRDNVAVLNYFLSLGVDHLEVNNQDSDCLAIAARHNCFQIARILLDRINPTKLNYNTSILRALGCAGSTEMRNLIAEYFPGTFSIFAPLA